jgi:AcrR family transcriptional regulator
MVFCVKRDRKAREEALKSAAARLFAQKGYENTRTLEIARLAGVNEALINRYFGGKEGLLMAVLQGEETSDLVRIEGLDPAAPDLRSALRTYFERGRKRVEERESFMRIAMSRSLLQPELAVAVREKIIDRQMEALKQGLQERLQGAKLGEEELEAYAMLVGAVNHTFNFVVRKVHHMPDEKVERVFDLLTDALLLKLGESASFSRVRSG